MSSSGSSTRYAFQPRADALLTRGHSTQPKTCTSKPISPLTLYIIASYRRPSTSPTARHRPTHLLPSPVLRLPTLPEAATERLPLAQILPDPVLDTSFQ